MSAFNTKDFGQLPTAFNRSVPGQGLNAQPTEKWAQNQLNGFNMAEANFLSMAGGRVDQYVPSQAVGAAGVVDENAPLDVQGLQMAEAFKQSPEKRQSWFAQLREAANKEFDKQYEEMKAWFKKMAIKLFPAVYGKKGGGGGGAE